MSRVRARGSKPPPRVTLTRSVYCADDPLLHANLVTKLETLVWEEHWIHCARNLNQWHVAALCARGSAMRVDHVRCAGRC